MKKADAILESRNLLLQASKELNRLGNPDIAIDCELLAANLTGLFDLEEAPDAAIQS